MTTSPAGSSSRAHRAMRIALCAVLFAVLLPCAAAERDHRQLMAAILDGARFGERWDRTIVLGIDAAIREGDRVAYWTRVREAMLDRIGWRAVHDDVTMAMMDVYDEAECRLIAEAFRHEGTRIFFSKQEQVQAVTSALATRLAERIMPELQRIAE